MHRQILGKPTGEPPMSHAETLHTMHPADGATDAIVGFVGNLTHGALSDEVRHYARRHLLDTVGVMIAGAGGEVASRAETVLAAVRPAGRLPVPGRARRADLLDAAFLGGTAAHGIELDDGYTKGSVHPGCTVVPAALALAHARKASGQALLEAVVAGYETVTAIGRAVHPDLRHRGFHPTGAVAVFGAAMAAGKLRGLKAQQLAHALGIAASSAGGLFAFVNGGGDIKRLHAGHASREGLPHRRRAGRDRLGRFCLLAAQLSLPDGARAEIPRHQVRLFPRGGAPRPGAGRARRQGPCQRARRDRPALSATAPGAGDDH